MDGGREGGEADREGVGHEGIEEERGASMEGREGIKEADREGREGVRERREITRKTSKTWLARHEGTNRARSNEMWREPVAHVAWNVLPHQKEWFMGFKKRMLEEWKVIAG